VLSDDRKLAVELVELERAQFGNELHDGVIPLLFVASSRVTNLRDKLAVGRHQVPGPANESDLAPALDQLSAWLDEAMQASRRLLTEVYPPDLDHRDWGAAVVETLHRLFPDWSNRVDWKLDPAVSEVSQAVSCTLYRIVLEAIRNACQHGDATEVLVSGRKLEQTLEITIFDNGTGFEVSRVPSDHFGIRAMNCRAELISGRLRIDSSVGGPTTVALVVPLAG
jgi:signal transduction histidine kinase